MATTPKPWAILLFQWSFVTGWAQFVNAKRLKLTLNPQKICSNIFDSTTKERALQHIFWIERCRQRFASKTLQNDSGRIEKFQHLRCCASFILFESCWNKSFGEPSTKTELITQYAFKEYLQTRLENGSKLTAKSRKCRNICRFPTFAVNFYLRLENFSRIKLPKTPYNETRSKACFSNKCLIRGRKLPQNDPDIGKTENYKFRMSFVQFSSNFHA